jgi:ABC-type dipeptide/oligopeptide/nickel transport system permease component
MSFVLRRLAGAVFVIFGTVTLVFLVLHWLPGDPAALIAGENATAETIANIRVQLGTDRPLEAQYASYLAGLLHGDLGTSFATHIQVLRMLSAQFLPTLALSTLAAVVAIVTGVMLGVLSAVNHGNLIDRTIQFVLLFLTAMPSFWLGILLILLFSVTLRWLPAIGNGSWRQLVLPVVCLGLITSGRLMRIVRSSMLDTLQEQFVTTLRGKGLREHQVMFQHVLRNALIPVVTVLGILIGELLSGTVVVETLFARQGIGRMLVDALGVKDFPVIQGTVLLASIIFVLINALVDLSYRWIDRRVQT